LVAALHGVVTVQPRNGSAPMRATARRIPGSSLLIVAALPTTDSDTTLHNLLIGETAAGAGAVALALVLGWLLVGAGLQPLRAMSRAARDIASGDDLDRGLGVPAKGQELTQLSEAIDGMLGRLRESFDAQRAVEGQLRQFVADASHELRTPLTSIRGYAELLRTTGGRMDDAQRAQSLGRIESEAMQLGRLVEDLLTLSVLDRGLQLRTERVDLRRMAGEAVDAARVRDSSREVELVAGPAVEVECDAGRIRQSVDNLLANARAHTPAGARVTLSVTQTANGGAELCVEDDGPGMPAVERAHALERFWRADASRTRHATPDSEGGPSGPAERSADATGPVDGQTPTGAGLGLSIVAAIAAAHGGTVTLDEGRDGRGLLVRLRLPATPPV
jgi:two-component system OmpR family sensor kinase